MPREEYDYLTDATRDGLTDRVKAVAAGWGKCIQFIYGILQGERKDPFAYFRSFYIGLCQGNVPTSPWDNDLALIRAQYSPDLPEKDVTQAAQATFHNHGELFEKYLAAISDGKITLAELDELEPIVEVYEGMVKVLKKAMRSHRVKLLAAQK
jgi:hypothetical protein